MNNFTKEINLDNKYLNIENYIDFAYENLNNISTKPPSYEEIFINKEFNTDYVIDYKNYIEEAFGVNWNKEFDHISIAEYNNLYSIISNK